MFGRGQIHTLEAMVASGIMLTTLFVAMSIPSPNLGFAEFETLQLKKYCDDILTLLTIENSSGVSTLQHYINGNWSKFKSYFNSSISEPLFRNLSLGTRLEVYNVSDNYTIFNSTGFPLPSNTNVVSSFRILIVNNSVYEVRVYAWFT